MMLRFNLKSAKENIRLREGGNGQAREAIIGLQCSVVYARPGKD